MSPLFIPLGVFVMVVLIVALVNVTKIQSLESELHRKLYAQEMEHERKMQELAAELKRITQRA
jgi:hypothetical protein